jgi:hypothetical protein
MNRDFTTVDRRVAAYLHMSKALKYHKVELTGDVRNPVRWYFWDPDNLGPRIYGDFNAGSLMVSALSYAIALSKTGWSVRQLMQTASKRPLADDEPKTAPDFEVPAEWRS